MCEVMRSPTLDMNSHPLRLRQPSPGHLSPLRSQQLNSPPFRRSSIPSADMFARRPNLNQSENRENRSPLDNSNSCTRDGMLKMKGPLTMELAVSANAKITTTRLPIILSVYSTPLNKYAVISQERVISKDCGYVNLKNCVVRQSGPKGFQITTCDGEKRPLVFHAKDERDAEAWMGVLGECTDFGSSSNGLPSPRSPGFKSGSPRSHNKPLLSLSALSEEEEEVTEEEEEEE